jgi:predicted MFS family arabinose efflux permease
MSLFKVRNFSVGNVATLVIYAGLSVAGFLITIFVQQYAGYSALKAGLVLIPITLIMFALSSRFGALAGKYGPRLFMGLGPILLGLGYLALLRVDHTVAYWTQMFPGLVLIGLGLSITVAPLTSAILGCIQPRQAGIASAVNNAVARIAGLLAIAVLGIVTGSGALTLAGFHRGIVFTAILMILGGIVSAIGIQNNAKVSDTSA